METIRDEDIIALDETRAGELKSFLAAQNVSLKSNELERIRDLLHRNPTLVELHIFNVMWSEHCSYKSSKAVLKKFLPTDGAHVVLGPGEDAGIIRFHEKGDRRYCLVLAHESHNHPSQVLPVEGAATGIGGIVRDVYCMGADVIGVMDPLRFGDPDGPNARRVRDIVRGVVDGIAQYGNALGVPTYGGEAYFDASFDDNCLVNVVALGMVEEGEIVRSRAPEVAAREPFHIVLIGKPTDASGFGGAAFASERLSGDPSVERQEAVQVPDPFLKRMIVEATKVILAEARRQGVPIGFKDLGAGGIACAVSEMAQAGGAGAVVDLDAVNKSSDNLAAQVIACSETQERFAMFVPASFSDTVLRVYNDDFDLPHIYTGAGAYVIGYTASDRRFKLKHGGRVVCDADVDAITTGIEYRREARPRARTHSAVVSAPAKPVKELLVELLSSYNIADKSILFQHYDAEVQGRAVLRPGEADAAVCIFVPGEPVGLAAAVGGHSMLADSDPYLGGVWSVVEAVRNVACVGGRALAITDCLNYGDPEDPEVFWDFSEGVRGIGDACRGLKILDDPAQGIPVVSGNVSFYNQSGRGKPIAPTPIVACAGRVDDASISLNLGFKQSGSRIVLLGELHDRIGGSEYARHTATAGAVGPAAPDFSKESAMIRAVIEAANARLFLAAHDVSHGGLAVALAEMMMASAPFDLGCTIDLTGALKGRGHPAPWVFSEYGGIVVEIARERWPAFERILEDRSVPWTHLGETCEHPRMELRLPDETVSLSIETARAAHRTHGKCNALFA
jgi:phosphoribosylformylglycinamidine synthase II